MRARVRRGRRTSVVAATETWLAPVDVAGASAERFSFIAYLISAVHCKLTSANKQPAPAMLVHRSFRSLGVLYGNSIEGFMFAHMSTPPQRPRLRKTADLVARSTGLRPGQ